MDALSILYLAKFYLPLSILIIILFYHLTSKNNNKNKNKLVKYGILLTVIIILLISAYSTISTYFIWKQDPLSRFLLPPYDSLYFYQYSYFHYWKSCVVIFIISATWTLFLFLLYRYSKGRIIDKNEIYLGLFIVLSVGFPLFIPYIFILFTLFLLHQITNNFILKKSQPIAISLSMIVSAIIVILLGNNILIRFGLEVFKV